MEIEGKHLSGYRDILEICWEQLLHILEICYGPYDPYSSCITGPVWMVRSIFIGRKYTWTVSQSISAKKSRYGLSVSPFLKNYLYIWTVSQSISEKGIHIYIYIYIYNCARPLGTQVSVCGDV